jgi:hypothetical protein
MAPPRISFGAMVLVLFGALALAIGANQPWVKAQLDIVVYQPSGLDEGGGWWLIGGALTIGIGGVIAWQRPRLWWIPFVTTLGVGVLAGLKFVDTLRWVDDLRATGGTAQVGVGWWIVAAALVVSLLGSIRLRSNF